MFTTVRDEIRSQLEGIQAEGLFKPERVIVTPQQATVKVSDGREVLMVTGRITPISRSVADAAHASDSPSRSWRPSWFLLR